MPDDFTPGPGDVYVVKKSSTTTLGISSEDSRSRMLGISFDLSFLRYKTEDVASEVKDASTDIKYGWNQEKVEYGPLFTYNFATTSSGGTDIDTKTLLLGGFFDYNFTPNTADIEGLWAIRATLGVGQLDDSTKSKASGVNQLTVGLVYKWFGLSTTTALDLDMSYVQKEISADSVKTKVTGPVMHLGVQNYF